MVGVGIDQGFFYYFFRVRHQLGAELSRVQCVRSAHCSAVSPRDSPASYRRCQRAYSVWHYAGGCKPYECIQRGKACASQDKRDGGRARLPRRLAKLDEAGTFARTARQGWLKQVQEARITAATVSWSLRASAAIASLVGKLPLEASLRLRAESSAAFLAVGLRCFAQSFARYTLRHFTEREVVPNASVRQGLLHAAPEAEAALDLLQDAEHSLAVLGRQAAEAQGGGRNESEGAVRQLWRRLLTSPTTAPAISLPLFAAPGHPGFPAFCICHNARRRERAAARRAQSG
mmetsp:Transcript_1909/g.6129  ORF Transcript_1909/g.6129 Transcript_1909/m.6129 type:complete len:289 (-) Transcript_1909:116-982(-)